MLTLVQARATYLRLVKPVLAARESLGDTLNAEPVDYARLRRAARAHDVVVRRWNAALLATAWPTQVAESISRLAAASAADLVIVRRYGDVHNVDEYNEVSDMHVREETGNEARAAAELVRTQLGLPPAAR